MSLEAQRHDHGYQRRCWRCHSRGELVGVTMTDDSGASLVLLCAECRRLLNTERCGLCGELKDDGSRAGHAIDDDTDASVPICSRCRHRVLKNGGGRL